MQNQKITVLTISDPTGTHAPSAGANGELGELALRSDINNVYFGANALTYQVTTISHNYVDIPTSYPVVTLTTPSSSSLLFVQGVTNRTNTSFDAILSSTPSISGYILNWVIFNN